MARGIKELKKQFEDKPEEFNKIARRVTENYVNSLQEYSQEQIAKDFDITTSTVRKLMDYAIIEALVSRETAEYVMRKSVENQRRKHPEAGGTSVRHHYELIKEREKRLAEKCDVFDVDMTVSEILYGTGDANVAIKTYNIESMRVYKLMLRRAIVENICSDEDTDKLIERSLKDGVSIEKIRGFRKIIQEREEYKRRQEETHKVAKKGKKS